MFPIFSQTLEILEAEMTYTPKHGDVFNAIGANGHIARDCPCICNKATKGVIFATQTSYDCDGDVVYRTFPKCRFRFEKAVIGEKL